MASRRCAEGLHVPGHPRLPRVQRSGGRGLDREELPGVHERLHARQGRDGVGAARRPTDPPARHVVRLREGVELDGDLAGAVDLQDARRGGTRRMRSRCTHCRKPGSRRARDRTGRHPPGRHAAPRQRSGCSDSSGTGSASGGRRPRDLVERDQELVLGPERHGMGIAAGEQRALRDRAGTRIGKHRRVPGPTYASAMCAMPFLRAR
jgi:hypothetical protein